MAGRPTDYTEDLALSICEQIAEGKSLRSICAQEDMPAKSTVFKWLTIHQEFADHYAHARDAQADALADEIIDIADDSALDTIVDPETGRETTNAEIVARSRLRVDARKWVAAKLKPKKYGDRTTTEHTGADGGEIAIIHKIERVIVRPSD